MKKLPLFKWDGKRGICIRCDHKKVRYYSLFSMGDSFNKLVVDCLNNCFSTHMEFFMDKAVEEIVTGKKMRQTLSARRH